MCLADAADYHSEKCMLVFSQKCMSIRVINTEPFQKMYDVQMGMKCQIIMFTACILAVVTGLLPMFSPSFFIVYTVFTYGAHHCLWYNSQILKFRGTKYSQAISDVR
jgi:hypothetical protein